MSSSARPCVIVSCVVTLAATAAFFGGALFQHKSPYALTSLLESEKSAVCGFSLASASRVKHALQTMPQKIQSLERYVNTTNPHQLTSMISGMMADIRMGKKVASCPEGERFLGLE